jgi:hypothetical protein
MGLRGLPSRRDWLQRRAAIVQIEFVCLPVSCVDAGTVYLRVDVAIGDEHVFQPIVVYVDECNTPAQVPPTLRYQAGAMRIVPEVAFTCIAVKRVVVIGEVGDHDVKPAVVVEIVERDAHTRLLAAILTESDVDLDRYVGQSAVAIVAVELIWRIVVGDEQVRVTIVVVVSPGGGEAVVRIGVDPQSCCRVCERPIAIVAIEGVTCSFQAARSASNRKVLVGAELAFRSEVLRVIVEVIRHEHIQIAVAVVVRSRSRSGPSRISQA